MTLLVLISVYAAVAIFFAGCLRRAVQYARMPLHLRWELYPVPHEAPDRAAYGGSYFEESEWWTKPRRFHLAGELRVMLPEMLLLSGLRHANPRLWRRSFPFHVGLYAIIAAAVTATVAGLADSQLMYAIARAFAWAGVVSTCVGAIGLLVRRVRDVELRNYTYPADLAHLASFAFAAGLLIAAAVFEQAPSLATFVFALGTFDTSVRFGPLFSAGVVLGSAIVAYVPFSHMAHFIAKYFLYHSIRWDDAATNDAMATRIAAQLALRPNWAARHIGADGTRTWAEIATLNPVQEKQK